MERLTIDDIITLEDGKEYFVVEIVEENSERYLYLVNESNSKVIIGREIITGEDIEVETLDDIEKITEITRVVLDRFALK